MPSDVALEIQDVLSHYNLGELFDFEKNERGFVNTAFAIETLLDGERRRFFLRKYKRGVREEELQFEHALIDHLIETGVPAARIHRTRSGKTYLHRSGSSQDSLGVFYTIFDYLPGEDRFTWVDPVLSEAELSASGVVLARFHIAGAGFTPAGRRTEPKIIDLLPVIAETWSACPGKSKGTVFDACLLEHFDRVQENIRTNLTALQELQSLALPEFVIHCDYHPGNLKFEDEQIVGLFDFDWSKIDLRAFDVALALWYFCTSWQVAEDGHFRLEWAQTFLRAYLETLAAQPGAPRLTQAEVHYLPALINAANLYVLNWTILDYFSKDVDPEEYLVFLKHSLNFTLWYEDTANRQALERLMG
jgi:homoserine kinase type II